MKRTLCILLALMTTVVLMSTAVFATEEAADPDTEVVTEEAAEEAPAEDAETPDGEAAPAPAEEEEQVPIQILELTVNKDGSSVTTLTMPVPKDYEDQIDGIVEQYNGMGVATEVIDDYQGFKAIKVTSERDASQPCNVSTPGSESAAFDAWVIKGLFKNTTIMNATYDFSQGYYEEGEEIAQIIIHLPAKAKQNNAESVKGKTYEWVLKGGQSNPIRFVYDKINLVGWIACAALLCLIIVLLLALLSKKNKKDNDIVPESFENNIAEGLDDVVDSIEETDENAEEDVEEVKEEIEEKIDDITPEQ